MTKNNPKYIVGVSFGRSGIEVVAINDDLVIEERESRPYPGKVGKESVAARIEKAVTSLPSFHMAVAVGICLPAVFDSSGKKIISSSIEELAGVDIYQLLAKKINLPIFVQRRNFCFLLAEQAFGGAKDFKNAVLVEIGRDVCSAILLGGKIFRGTNNGAGEIGKVIVDITREKRNSSGEFGALVTGEGLEALTGKSVYQILKENPRSELVSKQIIRDLKESLLTELYNIKLLLDPEAFVIGGDILENFSLFKSSFANLGVKVRKSELGVFGPALGAAIVAYNGMYRARVAIVAKNFEGEL
jgi:predicted NBD/HSP70 family sugar kinase